MRPVARAALITALMPVAWAASAAARRRVSSRPPIDGEELVPLAALPEGLALWRWDARKRRIWTTRRFDTIFGVYSSRAWTRESLRERIDPHDRPKLDAWFADSCPGAPRTDTVSDVLRLIAAVDGQGWIAMRAVIRRDAHGHVRRASGVVIDISEHKRSERESAVQQQQLAHLTRVAILGQLSGALAHELNQPLASILSNAQAAQGYLSQHPVDLDEVRASLDDIVNSDRRASEIIHRLRELLRRGGTAAERLELEPVVHEALELIRTCLKHSKIKVSVSMPRDLCAVYGDRVQIEQVVLNLLVNACEAMSNSRPHERRIKIVADNDGASVHLRVIDYGVGIARSDLESIFDPFYTTKSDGLGLGLAISRSIVAAHGGRLWATANEGTGSCIHMTLPAFGFACEDTVSNRASP